MTVKEVDKAARRLRAAVEAKTEGEPPADRELALTVFDLAIGVARNLAILASK